jgi:uncharacterized protein YggE
MDLNPSPTLLSASRGVRYAAVAALSILALFLLAKTIAVVSDMGHTNPSNVASITVTGTGKASVAPNVATITFTVQENASTVAAAQNAATKRTDNALAAIKKLGVADADVQTSGYNVNPQYETKPCVAGGYCPQDTSKIIAYQVSQSITVKVRDTAKAGDVLAALGNVGVQNVSGPNFMVDDPGAVQADARGKAIADARAKAEVLASQLGVRLGKVVGFSENGSPVPMPYYAQTKAAGMDAAAGPVAPTLPVGTSETNVTVTVVYEIQ